MFCSSSRFCLKICVWLLTASLASAQLKRPPTITLPSTVNLAALERIALQYNPRLLQAEQRIRAAHGMHLQAGLYPNPQLTISGDELGSPISKWGVITAPYVSQEIVTGGKLALSQAVAKQKINEAGLSLVRERFALLTAVRQRYFETLALQYRAQVLQSLVKSAEQAYDVVDKLVKAKSAAELDRYQIRAELNELRATLSAAEQQKLAAWRALMATVGQPFHQERDLDGSLSSTPAILTYEKSRDHVLRQHPEMLIALVGVQRARASIDRARAQVIPNVTVGVGYQRQSKDDEHDWRFQVGVPLPIFNRNEGNIQSAEAELGQASQEVHRVANDLVRRLSLAFGDYSAALKQVELYRESIRPDTQIAYELAQKAYNGGAFGYLRVLQALRANQQANLKLVTALAEMWKAASLISGLMLELNWTNSKGEIKIKKPKVKVGRGKSQELTPTIGRPRSTRSTP